MWITFDVYRLTAIIIGYLRNTDLICKWLSLAIFLLEFCTEALNNGFIVPLKPDSPHILDSVSHSFFRIFRKPKNQAIVSLIAGLIFLNGAAFFPQVAEAGVLSFFFGSTPEQKPVVKPNNSQTMPLLQAPLARTATTPSRGGGDITIVDGTSLLPESGISGTAADIPETLPATSISIYVVREGDTLGQIAQMFNVSVNTIIWANDLQGKTIKKDQVLVILPISGVKHVVAKGDTVESIAKKYKADVNEILQYNDLTGGDLTIGDTVLVPDAEITIPVVASKPSTGKKGSSLANPYRGGSGPRLDGYYGIPITSAHRTQGIHGYNGVDLGAQTGTPILAAAGGTVIVAKQGGYNGGYGSYVVISHDNGTQTLYGHMSQVYVSVGNVVPRGQVIGAVGMTGHATGPHLHFEVRGAVNFCADADNPCSTY